MNAVFNNWLQENLNVAGVAGGAIRYPNKTNFSFCRNGDFPQPNMEMAWRCMGDTFQVLKLHKKPASRLRWKFQNAVLHCVSRNDGVCLGVIITNDSEFTETRLSDVLREFVDLKA